MSRIKVSTIKNKVGTGLTHKIKEETNYQNIHILDCSGKTGLNLLYSKLDQENSLIIFDEFDKISEDNFANIALFVNGLKNADVLNIVFKTPSKMPKNYIDYAETGSIKCL